MNIHPLKSKYFYFFFLILSYLALFCPQAFAQVSISVGIQEVYDDNIFLEDDLGGYTEEAFDRISALPLEVRTFFGLPTENNGEPDSDIISNLTIGLTTNYKLAEALEIDLDANIGAAIFADNSDENRYILDTFTNLSPQEGILPKELDVNLSSSFNTNSYNVGVTEGTLARESLRHVLSFETLFKRPIDETLNFSSGYRFSQHDFLGESTFGGSEEDLEERFQEEENGAEYRTHSLIASLRKNLSELTSVGAETGAVLYDFQASGDEIDRSTELDRREYRVATFISHKFSERFSASAKFGASKSDYKNSFEEVSETITGLSGTEEVVFDREEDPTTINFDLSAAYALSPLSQISFTARQDTAVGIRGERVLRKDATLGYNTWLNERVRFFTSGKILLNEDDDNGFGDNSYKRYSLTLGSSYSITESMSISGGWNFTTQEAENQDRRFIEDGFLYLSDDYVSNRFYVSLNKGFVGIW